MRKARASKYKVTLGPSTRYQGSKRKLISWLQGVLGELRFTTAVDLMSGTGTVAYMLKGMGKRVIANDYLHSNYATLVAFIENPSTSLSDEDFEWLVGSHTEVPSSTFVADTFSGFYFTGPENEWLDRVASNVTAFRGRSPAETKYKKALAKHALVQACLMKRPFNLFHRKNLYIRRADVHRTFGNKTTWETPFSVLFKRLALEGNRHVFSNGLRNRALSRDALRVRAPGAELVYIDPPYFRAERDRAQSNYRLLYHFVDGLVRYPIWGDLIDDQNRLKLIDHTSSTTDEFYTCARSDLGHVYLKCLKGILEREKKIILVRAQSSERTSQAERGAYSLG